MPSKTKEKPIKHYLTESSLGTLIAKLFPNETFIHNKQVPDSGNRCRPDYRCDRLNLIIEYDGDSHFVNPEVILRDRLKDYTYERMGYSIVRIPYFVQLNSTTLSHYLGGYPTSGLNDSDFLDFPHGFITPKCVTPAKFCAYGIYRFNNLLKSLPEQVRGEVIDSLISRCLADGADKHQFAKLVASTVPVDCECFYEDPLAELKQFCESRR